MSPVIPGASAEKSCIPPIPRRGSIAIAKTIIPIPPNQCVILLQKIILSGRDSISFITVDPVVVYPDIVSKKILENDVIEPVDIYGTIPERTIINQPSMTIKYASLLCIFLSLFFENSIINQPVTTTTKEEKNISLKTPS